MEIKASYAAALFILVYLSVGIFINYYFTKKLAGRFSGQGYKLPVLIYFIGVPIIVTLGTNFFSNYDPNAIYRLFTLDQQFLILIFVLLWSINSKPAMSIN